MNVSKKTEIKRLIIYLILSFGMAWTIFIIYILTGNKWDGSNANLESFVGLGMLTPFLAHILTRWITKEGFAMTGKDSIMLGISFKNKKWIFFLFALFIPWIVFEAGYAITLVFFPDLFDMEIYKQFGIDKLMVYFMPVISIISATIISFAALGEEAGWRGYMMPKLIKIMGMKKALIAGGIIWGLWHAPLTCIGHNFGTDYPGFPYLGILLMCIDCVCMGIVLTFITVKTGSVWPAAIMHSVNNANPCILSFFMNLEKAGEIMPNPLLGWVFLLIPNIVFAIICFVVLCRERSK